MENEVLSLLNNIKVEALVIGIVVCLLTMFIKQPIKKATSSLEDAKRKAYNSLIILIPMILSCIISTLYLYCINKHIAFSEILQLSAPTYLVSFLTYSIIQRIVIIINGVKTNSASGEIKENVEFVKNIINELTSKLDIDKQQLENLQKQIDLLFINKKKLEDSSDLVKIEDYDKNNQQIILLSNEKNKLIDNIEQTEKQILLYQEKIL